MRTPRGPYFGDPNHITQAEPGANLQCLPKPRMWPGRLREGGKRSYPRGMGMVAVISGSSGQQPLQTQQLNLTSFPQPALGNTLFPPPQLTAAGGGATPLAAFGAQFLSSVLPTNRSPVVSSPLGQAPSTIPGLPSAPGGNQFAAQYSPQIYSVVLNGLLSTTTVQSATLVTPLANPNIARPTLIGNTVPEVPGLPPIQPLGPSPAGTGQVIASLRPLAGSGSIFGGAAPAPQAPAPAPAPAPVKTTATPAPAAKT